MHEEWRDVIGYEGLYQVSNLGRVRSLDRWCPTKGGAKQLRKGKLVSIHVNRYGYEYVSLSADGKHKNASVHRLVLAAFVGESDLTVNHINEDKLDNRLCNLEYLSAKDNLNYGGARQRQMDGILSRRVPVECFDIETGETINVYAGVNEVRKYGFCPQSVSHCCNGKIKSHGGYGWRKLNGENYEKLRKCCGNTNGASM